MELQDAYEITKGELVGPFTLFLFAGHETITNYIDNGPLLTFIEIPLQMAKLRANPKLI
jgi:cytochrome P450